MKLREILGSLMFPGPRAPNAWEADRSEVKVCAMIRVRRRLRDVAPDAKVEVHRDVVRTRLYLGALRLKTEDEIAIAHEIADDLGIDPGRLA